MLPARPSSAASASARTKARFDVGRWKLLQRQPAQPAAARRPSWRQAPGPRHRRRRSAETCLHTRCLRAKSCPDQMPQRLERRTSCFPTRSLSASVANGRIAERCPFVRIHARSLPASVWTGLAHCFVPPPLLRCVVARHSTRTPRVGSTLPADCRCGGSARLGSSRCRGFEDRG